MRSSLTRPIAWLVDLVLLLVFVAIGRASHGEDATGFAVTLLPFLAGLQSGWLLAGPRNPLDALRFGGVVWLCTLVVGMLLRVASGEGAAPAFVVVTAVVLGVFLLGWRLLAAGIQRLRPPRADAASRSETAPTPGA